MPSSSSAPRGVLLAGLGALAALGSLWLPWYTIKLPDSFRDALGNIGGTGAGNGAAGGTGADGLAGAFAGMFKSLAAVMPEEITANGWTAMSGGDVGLAVAASIVVLLVLVAGGLSSGVRVDRGVAGRMIAFAGLVVTAIAVYHVVSKPGAGAGAFSANVAIKPGLWLALLGGVLMIAGGLMTSSTPKVKAAEPTATPEPVAADGAMFAPPVDGAATMAAHDPSTAPVLDPFAVPAPMPAAAHDPFASPEPYVAPAAAHDPFASPEPYAEPAAAHDPFAAPAEPEPVVSIDPYPSSDPVVSSDPYSSPDPYPSSDPLPRPEPHAVPEPYGSPTPYPSSEPVIASSDPYPSSEPVVSSDPYPSSDPLPRPEPHAVPEPYGSPASYPSSEPVVAHAADEAPVPDWTGFQPEPAPEPEPVMSAHASEPRPAGVSIPPPGWTGA